MCLCRLLSLLACHHAGDGSRVWSYQVPVIGQDEPRGNKMLHVHQATGTASVVITNGLSVQGLRPTAIYQQIGGAPSHKFTIVSPSGVTTTTSSKTGTVTGVALTLDNELWWTIVVKGSSGIFQRTILLKVCWQFDSVLTCLLHQAAV
jgi:hypothetical protein